MVVLVAVDSRVTVPLAAVSRGDVGLAGGKGANLGELVRAGLPVPPGFVVTTGAYRRAVADAPFTAAAGQSDGDGGAAMRAAVRDVHLPADITRAVADSYDALGGGAVAVRSSATAEDLPGAAFAGQQDTFLGVVGVAAVVRAVRDCWASLWNERAVAYRARLGIDPAGLAIAVVVQKMVPADVAGVLFTADPVTGARDRMVIDAGDGLGETVVSGLVTPDHVVMTSVGRLLSYTVGRREVVLRSLADGSVSRTTDRRGAGRLLNRAACRQLAAAGRSVGQLFGAPQDIEWAIAGGRLHILQARPMTALPIPLRLGRVRRFVGGVLADFMSVRPYPLDMTTWVPHGPAGMMDEILTGLGLRAHLDRVLPERHGVVVQFVPPRPTPTWRILALPARVLLRARRYDPARWTDDPRYLKFDRARANLLGRDVTGLSWAGLLDTARQVMRLVDPITDLRARYLPAFARNLLLLRLELVRIGATRLMSALIGGAPTHTAAGNQRLEELAAAVRSDDRLAALLDAHDSGAVLAALRTDRAFEAFTAEFDAYLEEFGYRETESPVLISSPTWADRPDMVIDLIRVLATVHDGGMADTDTARDAEAELLASPRLRNPRRRSRVQRRIAAARAGVAFREDSHNAFTRLAPVLRRTLLELGNRLTRQAVITDPFDVFHLRFEELATIADIDTATAAQLENLTHLVRDRMLRREQIAAVPMINYAAIFKPRKAATALVTGTPACAGAATGPVRIIRTIDEFATLQPGDILVCPYTNPAWTPLFQRAAAVVVDTGGIGSHAAIVARENGIPAVMGTGTGTRTLTAGQMVRVDGTAGTVTAA